MNSYSWIHTHGEWKKKTGKLGRVVKLLHASSRALIALNYFRFSACIDRLAPKLALLYLEIRYFFFLCRQIVFCVIEAISRIHYHGDVQAGCKETYQWFRNMNTVWKRYHERNATPLKKSNLTEESLSSNNQEWYICKIPIKNYFSLIHNKCLALY